MCLSRIEDDGHFDQKEQWALKEESLPSFPPDGPWDAYVSIIIWIPLILRILLLVVPFRRAIGKLAPHTGWVFKQIRQLVS